MMKTDPRTNLLDHMEGQTGVTKLGMEWLATCRCGSYIWTENTTTVEQFIKDHEGCNYGS
jgi:hypothetical protein